MNVLFLLDRFPQNGGVERVTIALANLFVKKGLIIHILSQKGDKDNLLETLDENVLISYLDSDKFKCDVIVNYITDNRIDVIINQGAYPKINRILKRVYQKCFITIFSTLHNEPDYRYKWAYKTINGGIKGHIKRIFRPLYLYYIKHQIRNDYNNLISFSKKIILLSDSYVPKFLIWATGKKDENKITVIPNPITISLNKTKAEIKKNTIIYVGRFVEEQKRISRQIKIWGKIWEKYPNWTFELYGDGEDAMLYHKIIKTNNLRNISLMGFRDDMSIHFAKSKILFLTSDYEGLPLVLIEAMSMGCVPIVYGTFSAAYDIIDNNINGIIIPEINERKYLDSIDKLIKNPDILNNMSRHAMEKAKKYSTTDILKKWLDLFNANKQ